MVAIPKEHRLSLRKLAELAGVTAHTTWRWSAVGIDGILLPTFLVGGRRFTTREFVEQWRERVEANRRAGIERTQQAAVSTAGAGHER